MIVFFVGARVIPGAKELALVIEKYPVAVADPRAWFALALVGLWGTMGLVCGLLAQAFNKRLIVALHEGD